MTKYSYKATNTAHKTVAGTIDASDRSAAISALRKQDLTLLSLGEEGESQTKKGGLSFGKRHVKSSDLVIFTRQLSTMVSAGVPLLRSLTALQTQTDSTALKLVLEQVNKDVQGGMALADALGKHPGAFSSVYINMVRAGEAGGILDEILKRLATQQEKNDSMRKKIKGAMTYPAVLLSITTIAFFGLMIFVIPQIGNVIKNLAGKDAQLPPVTQVMLAISHFMVEYWYIVIVGMFLFAFLFRRYTSTPRGREQFQTIVLKLPIVGPVIKKIAVARFARTFASLMGAGVNVLDSLSVTGRAIGNTVYIKELDLAAHEIKNGKQLSQVLSSSPLFPAIISQMLAVGEETGQTDTVLIKVADFYEEEVDTTINSLSSILEPVLIVIMGSAVGLIAYSVMGPIANLATQIH